LDLVVVVVVVVLGVMVVVGAVVLAVVEAGDYLRAGQVCDLVGIALEIVLNEFSTDLITVTAYTGLNAPIFASEESLKFKYQQAMLVEIE
jgi:hypothetical protein